MTIDRRIWEQLKNITCNEIISALKKDGWTHDITRGAVQVYVKGGKRVTIHYHPGKTYGEKLLKGLLDDIGWTTEDLKQLGLVKKVG